MGMIERFDHCMVCDGSRLSSVRLPEHWIAGSSCFDPVRSEMGLSRCSGCGVTFVNPRPTQQLLDVFYSGDEYSYHSANLTAIAREKAKFLQSVITSNVGFTRGMQLLDYGCGGGFFLKAASDMGWNAVGLEPGQAGRESCLNLGVPVVENLSKLEGAAFDVIILQHVLEHVAAPGDVLKRLRSLLKPSGILLVEVPNANSLRALMSPPFFSRHFGFDERYRAYPIHLFYYTRRSLCYLLRDCSFCISRVLTSGMGIDRLFRQEETVEDRMTDDQRPRQSLGAVPFNGLVKQLIKKCLYGSMIGENLMVIAMWDPE